MDSRRVRTYRDLFAVREFRALFAATSASVAASTLSGLALGTLVYDRTGSPLLAALSMFGSSFGQVLGATTLLSAADRLRPRPTLTSQSALFALVTLLFALPGLPVVAILALGLSLGVVSSLGSAVRWGLVTEILPEGGYILGRSALNMAVGTMQITGYATGAVLLHRLSVPALLIIGAALYAVAGLAIARGTTARPARATGRASVRETWSGNRALLGDRHVRHLLLASWVPNGLVVGAEALFIPYAGRDAGALFVAAALGMLAGDVLVGRVLTPRLRRVLVTPTRVLLALPYLAFAASPGLPLAVALVALASVGFCATVLQQERMVAVTPAERRGQLLGLQSSGMLTMQAVGASLAGLVAEALPVGQAMTAMAVASLLASALLTPGLREPTRSGGDRTGSAVVATPPGSRDHLTEPAVD